MPINIKLFSKKHGEVEPVQINIERHDVIVKAVSIDYGKTKKYAKTASAFIKPIKALLPSFDILALAAEEYNNSTLENEERDKEYVISLKTKLDIPFIIETITPIVDSIPGGVFILNVLHKLENKGEESQ